LSSTFFAKVLSRTPFACTTVIVKCPSCWSWRLWWLPTPAGGRRPRKSRAGSV